MTVKKGASTITFVCDECGWEHDTGMDRNDDFHEALDDLRRFGWAIRKTPEGAWTHLCGDCR